ncbi:hypothetical protein BDW69DRAFT_163253 [Aspergillus filifer]
MVDLVHPSLFPVIYGRTRVLHERLLGLDNCLDSIQGGEVIPVPPKDQTHVQTPKYSLADRTEPRISLTRVEFEEGWEEPDWSEDVDKSVYENELEQFYKNRRVKAPDAGEFRIRVPRNEVNFQRDFPGRNLQVIVKLANIELTPKKPRYEGGSWHIEGKLVSRPVL